MRTVYWLTGHFFLKRLLSWRNGAFLLVVIGVLLAGALDQQASRQHIHSRLGAPTGAEEGFVLPISSLQPGSGRLVVWEAVTATLRMSEAMLGGPLLLLRAMTPLLAFFLLLAGLLYAYDMVSHDIETRLMDSLLGIPVDRHVLGLSRVFGETLALTLTLSTGCIAALITVSAISDLHWTMQQLARMVVFLLVLGGYCFAFVLLGMWISAKARSSRRALWIAAIVFVSIFSVHVIVENAMSIGRVNLPGFPDLPNDVIVFVQGVEIRGNPSASELPTVVAQYVDDLDTYSRELAETLRARYRAERWWSYISLPALLMEVSGRILQDQYYDVLDVFYSPAVERRPASLGASLLQTAGEIAWLVVLCVGLMVANIRTLSRLEV